MKKQGYRIEIEPNLHNGSNNKPDYLVHLPNGSSFYLEVTVENQNGNTAKRISDNETYLINHLNKKIFRKNYPNLKNLMIGICFQNEYTKPINIKLLVRAITEALPQVETDTPFSQFLMYTCPATNNLIEFVAYHYQDSDLDSTSDRIFNHMDSGFISIDPGEEIKKKIKNKAKKYGEV